MKNNILNCPFCGGKAEFYHEECGDKMNRYYLFKIKCISCCVTMKEKIQLQHTESTKEADKNMFEKIKELITKKWNKRK